MRTATWRQATPYRVEIRQGGGWLSVFGAPFLAAGLFMLLSIAGVVPVRGAESTAAHIVLPLMGLAFTAVGGALVFGRVWTAIDRAEGTFERQWGLLVPMRTETSRLTDCEAVVIGFSPGDSDTAEQFPVTLKMRSGQQRKAFSATTYAEARECATLIARLLTIDVEDASTDHPVRVPADSSAFSLSERLRADGPHTASAPRPSDMRSEVRLESNGVRITTPSGPAHPVLVLLTLVPVAVVAVVFGPFRQFFQRTNTPEAIGWIFLGFFSLLFGVLPGLTALNAVLRARRGATIVTVSPAGIQIDDRGAWRTTTRGSYTADDIFDLDFSTSESLMDSARRTAVARAREADGMAHRTSLSPRMERVLTSIVSFARSKGITVKTREGLVSFGAGLSDSEIRYLYGVVRQALRGSSRT